MDFSYSNEADVAKLKENPPTQEELEAGACPAVPHWHVAINLIHPETQEQDALFLTGSEDAWYLDKVKHEAINAHMETVKLINQLKEMGVDIRPGGPDGPPIQPGHNNQGNQEEYTTGFYL